MKPIKFLIRYLSIDQLKTTQKDMPNSCDVTSDQVDVLQKEYMHSEECLVLTNT